MYFDPILWELLAKLSTQRLHELVEWLTAAEIVVLRGAVLAGLLKFVWEYLFK